MANRQSNLFQEVSTETIRTIFEHELKESKIWETRLLDGGMFNTTYYVEYGTAHKKAVLRLGPVNRHLVAGFEENLMNAEVYTYSVCRKIGIPCSRVLGCDTSKEVIDRDFMIVEYIPSVAMVNLDLSEEKRQELYFQMGRYLAKLHQVKGNSFGFVSRICAGNVFKTWSEALIYEVRDMALRLAKAGGICDGEADGLLCEFGRSRGLLDEIREPHLLHTDLWSGNVLLDTDTLEIRAIIDADRAVFGDVDFEFACPWMEEPALQAGYGFVPEAGAASNRGKRRRLYQIFFYLLEAYVGYCEYNNLELYKVRKHQLLELLNNPVLAK